MSNPQWCIMVVPVEHGPAVNRLLNVINGDSGDNVSVPMSPDGSAPATHLLMSRPLTDAQKASYPYSKTAPWSLPSPHMWPLDGAVTEGAVEAAIAAAYINVNAGPNVDVLPMQNFATVCQALGLARVEVPI